MQTRSLCIALAALCITLSAPVFLMVRDTAPPLPSGIYCDTAGVNCVCQCGDGNRAEVPFARGVTLGTLAERCGPICGHTTVRMTTKADTCEVQNVIERCYIGGTDVLQESSCEDIACDDPADPGCQWSYIDEQQSCDVIIRRTRAFYAQQSSP